MRFHQDMLVLSASPEAALYQRGVKEGTPLEMIDVVDPEAVSEVTKLESSAGAQCLVTPTEGITRARLSHERMEDRAEDLSAQALALVQDRNPQHVIAQIGPTRLPIDPSSRASLLQNRNQYADAIRAFGDEGVDAFLFNDLMSVEDVRCACMGARMVTDRPLFASVVVDGKGNLRGREQSIEEACDVMDEYEADVAGIRIAAPLDRIAAVVERMTHATQLPIMIQLDVTRVDPRQDEPTDDNPFYCPDTMIQAGMRLRDAGAQFLRAVGAARASYTGALVAATDGTDAIR